VASVKRSLLLVPAILVTAAAITVAALEGREVAVLRTTAPGGQPLDTRVWVADDAGAAWIEAANADRPFLAGVARRPEVSLRRGGVDRACRATVLPNPAGHEQIRRLLAAKYGWADRWVGLLTDTSGSIAVRLDCS
jgi:hypothetical protein